MRRLYVCDNRAFRSPRAARRLALGCVDPDDGPDAREPWLQRNRVAAAVKPDLPVGSECSIEELPRATPEEVWVLARPIKRGAEVSWESRSWQARQAKRAFTNFQ